MGEHIEVQTTDLMSTVELGELRSWLEIPDLSPLWDLADESGRDVQLPRQDVDQPYPRFRRGTSVSLGFNLRGDLDRSNAVVAGLIDARTQLWDHRQYLAANVCGRSSATDGTRGLTLVLPDDSTASAPVHIGRRLYLAARSPVELTGTLRLTVIAGELDEDGS